ncbi:MAG TPA: RnfABCDGE type electron transport complex subunit C [Bacteroidales bacterium]|nr:RnfABCDGE type electron transport complex subunit C [Bacteroidales bacterium]
MKIFKNDHNVLDDNSLSLLCPIEILDIPPVVYIALSQHTGNPAIPIVKVNDKVKTGQLIAKAQGNISAHIHSSVSGTVTEIKETEGKKGKISTEIVIRTEGDEWLENIDRSNKLIKTTLLTPSQIINRIFEAGIVDLNGVPYPSHIKINVQQGQKAKLLIINATESESYIAADCRIMLEKTEEFIVGTHILMKALGIEKAHIAINRNKKEIIEKIKEISKNYFGIEITPLSEKYLVNGKKYLIKAITGEKIPETVSSLAAGYVVHDIESTFAIYEAVQKNKPLIEHIVTFIDLETKKAHNVLTRIGTPIIHIIEKFSEFSPQRKRMIHGNTVKGKELIDLNTPITKKTIGFCSYPKDNIAFICIRCSNCVDVCPAGIEPYRIALLSKQSKYFEIDVDSLSHCTNCGNCARVCPSGRHIVDLIRDARKILKPRNQN